MKRMTLPQYGLLKDEIRSRTGDFLNVNGYRTFSLRVVNTMKLNLRWPFYSLALLPYTRNELPGWGRLMTALGVYDNHKWAKGPRVEVKGKYHQYIMCLETSDYSDRITYFLGRYYDLATQLLMLKCVRPGDTFVDVGANIGMLSLLATRLVGHAGRVVCFEPNPDVYKRLLEHVNVNHLTTVSPQPFGLSDVDASLTLSVWANNKGWGTFGTLAPAEQKLTTAEYNAKVIRGDDILDIAAGSAVVIKIDVEGYETRVLRGLEQTLQSYKPAVITEVLTETLARAGSTPKELFSLMTSHGYRSFAIGLMRRGFRQHLVLREIALEDVGETQDVLWLHPESVHCERLFFSTDL
jgi:FkbM family methyltransferase